MHPIISVDLDSTLCDTRHRKGIVEKYREQGLEVDWDVYANACADDKPTALVDFLKMYQDTNHWVVVSGRSEGAREATEAWLEAHGLEPLCVFLEGEGNNEKHTQIGHSKFKALQVVGASKIVQDTFGVTIVTHFDDWPSVADEITAASNGTISTVVVTPPGMRAVFDTPDNPGEKAEVL